MRVGTSTLGVVVAMVFAANLAQAQVPANIEEGLKKIGQIVDPACTAKLYRPLMPKNDYNTYWPPDATAPASTTQLYPGITIARDTSFGPDPKDVIDIFTADKGGDNRPVLIYVPGGAGNKIEQQAREGNAFYDNIGRWATKNGMVGVLIQRHPGSGWDDGGRDISKAVDWLTGNVAKYKGDPKRMFIWAHSAGNGPLGVYVGHADRWPKGVAVKGAVFMSGNPVPGVGGGGRGAGAPGAGRGQGGPGGAPGGPQAGAACGMTGTALGAEGAIAGPSSARAGGAGGARGAGGGRGGPGQQLTPEQQAERDNLPGFKATSVKIMLVRAELDPGVTGDMTAADKALHDELCTLDGAKAKDGVGHCPAMLFAKGESHMSEVFSIDTDDKIVSGPILAWIKKIK
ncbi:MAG TPA: alpha/beta hydrolase [Vicinamibacterales bacterium]|nr:alpha/beta hydrolase [Vicinamibacterales bacterium]